MKEEKARAATEETTTRGLRWNLTAADGASKSESESSPILTLVASVAFGSLMVTGERLIPSGLVAFSLVTRFSSKLMIGAGAGVASEEAIGGWEVVVTFGGASPMTPSSALMDLADPDLSV